LNPNQPFQQFCEVGIIISILQINKLRFKVIKEFASGHTGIQEVGAQVFNVKFQGT
jgi:hypothetical protein